MTKRTRKNLSRCIGLYFAGAAILGGALYDMPSAYAFSDSAYNTINNNINDPAVKGLTIGEKITEGIHAGQYIVNIIDKDGNTSNLYMTEAQLGDGSLDLSKLQFTNRADASLDINIPTNMVLSGENKLDNGKSPINIKGDATLKLKGDTEVTGAINVDSGKTLTVSADKEGTKLTGSGMITNNGTIAANGANITAPLDNSGTIAAAKGASIDGTIKNTGAIKADGATISGTVTNSGDKAQINLNNSTLSGEIKGGNVDVSGTVKGTGSITGANSVSAVTGTDLSGMSNVQTDRLNVEDGVKLGNSGISAGTVKLTGTSAGVEGTVKTDKISVSEKFSVAENSNFTIQGSSDKPITIIVDTKDAAKAKEIAAKQVAGLITAKPGEEVKIVVSSQDGSSKEITIKADKDGQISNEALEEELAKDEMTKPPVAEDGSDPTPPGPDPTPGDMDQAAVDQLMKTGFDVTKKEAFITNDDLKALQKFDQTNGTQYYQTAISKLQVIASPTVATRQAMNVINSVSIGNVSERLDNVRSSKGHVGIYPSDRDDVKGASEDAVGNLWASIKHGKTDIKGDDAVSTIDYNYFQIGYDHQVGKDVYLGAYIGSTTGDVEVNGMTSDIDKAWDFGLYGTKLMDQGRYLNVIGKYGKMTNTLQQAEWDNKGYGVSFEFGQKIQQPAGFTITPYVQLNYDHASDSTVSGIAVPMELESSNSWSAKVGAKFEDMDAAGNSVYGGIAYSKGLSGSYSTLVNNIRLPEVDNDLSVFLIDLGVKRMMSGSSYFDLKLQKELLDYDGWNVQGVVNFAF